MSPDWLAQCYERPDELQPNSDIGGIGVLIGFMGTSGLVILFVIVHYIFAFNPSKDPFTGEETTSAFENHERKWTPNSIDETITMTLLSRLRDWLESRTKQRLRDVLTKAILTLCDVQLSTGLGILLSGYINLFHNAILAYHWKLLVYLVWISNLTHVCCLTILRGYLSQHRWERIWRVVLMFVLWGGLLSAFVPTLFLDWKKNDPLRLGATNTRCFFNPNVAEEIIRWRICKLHENGPESNMTAKQCVKYKSAYGESPAHEMEMTIPRGNLILLFQMTLYFALKIHLDSLLSDFVDILFLIVSATWGTVRLLNHRSSIKVDEDGWGFGQILAVFLLIGPVIAMITPLLEIVRPNKTRDFDRDWYDGDWG
ncbi:hypothetical protein CGMCC3_g8852 [Colletotrichum fructicola]|nr:uncharacterized protein CGMCC3_g8852 [Colletotrichum fructicola]KAE9575078.1 hypothetical protein CGMCC3_g8852 [Colletotrichum fructicola]